MSAVWEYFTVSEKDQRYAVCMRCFRDISRGGTTSKSFNTTNLISHLRNRHEEAYNDYLKADKKRRIELETKKAGPTASRPTITAFVKGKQFPAFSAKAEGIPNKDDDGATAEKENEDEQKEIKDEEESSEIRGICGGRLAQQNVEQQNSNDDIAVFCKNLEHKLRRIKNENIRLELEHQLEDACFHTIMRDQGIQNPTPTPSSHNPSLYNVNKHSALQQRAEERVTVPARSKQNTMEAFRGGKECPGQRLQTEIPSTALDTASDLPLQLTAMLPQIIGTQSTNAIVNFLIRDLHPPAMVEGEGFRHLIHTLLSSQEELPSVHLLEDFLKDLHTQGTKKLAELLRRRTVSKENEDVSNYTAPIEAEPRRRGRPPGSTREVPHFVTLSVDAWFHEWQQDKEHYATLWAHYIDMDFKCQNLALTTQRLVETGAGDCSLRVLEAQVKAIAQEWGISQPSLVVLGGDESEKMRLGSVRCEKSQESAGNGSYPNLTTYLEREDSVTSDELQSVKHARSTEEFPFIPCFFSAAQGCIEELMTHPVISKTLGLFQCVLSILFPLNTPKKDSSQQHIQSLLLTMPRQEQTQMKLWAHSQLSWKRLYSVLNTLLKHQNLVTEMIKEIKGEHSIRGDDSESIRGNSCCPNMDSNTLILGTLMAPKSSEWKVLEDLCLVLKPLDIACRTLAREAFPCLSLIKPILTGLLSRHLVPQPGDSSAILKEVKKMIWCNLASSYDIPVVNRALCVACALDPQFHSLGFMEVREQTDTYNWLKEEAIRMVKKDKRHSQAAKQSRNKRSSSPLSSESEEDYIRRSKRLKDVPPINFKELADVMDEGGDLGELEENETSDSGLHTGLSGMEFLLGDLFGSTHQCRQSSVEELVDMEISGFRADKGASLGVEPLQWWRAKEGQFPLLATVARAYLAAPAVAGNAAQGFLQEDEPTTSRKRATIPPEILDWILFLHHNRMPITVLRQPSNIKEESMY